jgi:choline-sulfatase
MFRRDFLSALAAGPLLAQSRRPNIVFLCSDQHSGRVLGANGHPIVRTPHLDRLASAGMYFRNAYTGSPVCVPGRAGMMTGMFPSDVGSYCNSTCFDGRAPSWGNRLKQAGYYCWATGKLDLTQGVDFGFHEVDTAHGHSQHPDITSLFRAPVCFRPEERAVVDGQFKDRVSNDAALIDRGLNFLRNQAPKLSQPWAMYIGMHAPHPKWVAQAKYRDVYPPGKMPLPTIPPGYLESRHTMFQVLANFKNISVPIPEDRVRRARAAYFAEVSEVDEYAGRIFDELEKTGQMDRTLFVYTADHGEMLGEHGLWLKNVLLENAARVPLIMAGAGLPKGKTVDAPVGHCDMVATMLDVAGIVVPRELRGHSLTNSTPAAAYSESHSEGNCTGSFMIRKGEWKYLYFTGDRPLLFNLQEDPGELRNLAGKAETKAIEQELHARLTKLVDPDQVTARAFVAQERVLAEMVRKMKPADFHDELEPRLGAAQARILTDLHYRRPS